ncbi:MAG: NAD-binding protein [bacterium]
MLFKKNEKRLIILGANELSINLANKLSKNFDIIVLDVNNSANNFQVDAIVVSIENDLLNTLIQYEIEKTSIFIAMTMNEEYNLFTAYLASNYGAAETIAMVFNPVYMNLESANYIFNPYQLIINKTNTLLKETRLRNIKGLIPGQVNIIDFTVKDNDTFTYKKIKNVNIKDSLIFAIKRNSKTLIPDRDVKLLPGDIVYLLYKKGMISRIFKGLWESGKINRSVFIIGGKDLGYMLAQSWCNIFRTVIIIESSIKRCHELANIMENVLVLNGEGTERELLIDEGLNNESIFLTYDNNDFHNLLSSYSARNYGCKNVITLLNHNKYSETAKILNLDDVISMPDLVTKHLLLHIKLKKILKQKNFLIDDLYSTSIYIEEESSLIKKKIEELDNKGVIKVAVIIRHNKVIIPESDNVLYAGDKVFLIFNKNMEREIYNIFEK